MARAAKSPSTRKRKQATGKDGEHPPKGASASGAAAEAPQLALEEILSTLDQVVTDLERGELPLEDALTRFEEGVRLVRLGNTLLEGAEQRVEVLLADRDETAPFAEGDEGA